MKLALLVTYFFDDALEPLVRVHLERIRRHTRSDYTIFGAAEGMAPAQRAVLEEYPEIRLVEMPDFAPRDPDGPIGVLQHQHNEKLKAVPRIARSGGGR